MLQNFIIFSKILVKLKTLLFSKFLGITYNLKWREYLFAYMISNVNSN